MAVLLAWPGLAGASPNVLERSQPAVQPPRLLVAETPQVGEEAKATALAAPETLTDIDEPLTVVPARSGSDRLVATWAEAGVSEPRLPALARGPPGAPG